MRHLAAFSLVLALACGSAPTPTSAAPPAATPAPAAPAPVAPPAKSGAPASSWVAPALPACDPTALLVKYDFEYVQRNYCELCKGQDEYACEFDWPSNDVPLCTLWDEMRNGIYAYYGYPFKKQEWREKFKSFYKEDPTFTEARMSAEAKRNIALLKSWGEQKKNCMGP